MLSTPYSVNIRKRPQRIAFGVNFNNVVMDDIISIIKYNQERWGGRYNQIVHLDGNVFHDEWWTYLESYDPDIFMSFIEMEDILVEEIDHRLTPYLIEYNKKDHRDGHISLTAQGYSILPTPDNVARAYGGPRNRATLVLFDIEDVEDELVRNFIIVNFGTYTPLDYIENQLKLNKVQRLKITDRASLVEAMQEISTYDNFVFPIQICTISPESRYQSSYWDSMFTVVVGNSIIDVIHAWNKGIMIPSHNRTRINQVWIPQELLDNHDLSDVLKRWIKIMATSRNDEQWHVRFISNSIDSEQLSQYSHTLGESLVKHVDWVEEYKPPTNACLNPFQFRGKIDLYRANSLEEVILIDEPEVNVGLFSDEYWMADVYIELTSQLFSHYIGNKFWWRLPRRNVLANKMFNAPSRIGAFGLPSIAFKRGDTLLKIKLLEEFEMFYHMSVGRNQYWFSSDLRSKLVTASKIELVLSDKGKYLYGFLELFGGLKAASHIFESRYWRQMIQELSNHDPRSVENRVEAISRLVQKKVSQTSEGYLQSDEGIEWIAHEILTLSTQQAREGKEANHQYFLRKAKKEAEEYCKKHNQKQKEYQQKHNQGNFIGIEIDEKQLIEDIKSAMGDLIRQRVLLMGTRAKCPVCGRINWIEIDDLSCFNECKGCRNEHVITPETPWYYKLNSLVEAGCAEHGLIPVTLAFGQLLDSAQTSFFFSPSLNLILDEKIIGDLDIVCIKDDQFIIGEIKQSLRHLTPAEIDKMYDLALLVRPDVVMFSTLDGKEPSLKTLEKIRKLQDKLRPMRVKVEWYPFDKSIFEASMYV